MKNELTTFESGGSHEQNSLGGVPIAGNLVEEKETKIKIGDHQYVFSDSLSTKKHYLTKFYLPSYISKKTFAEASKAIEERFKDRADNASNSTKDELFSRLQEAQELAKLEKEAFGLGISVEELVVMKEQEAEEAAQAQAEAEAIAAQQQSGQNPVNEGQVAPPSPQQLEEGGDLDVAGLASGAAGLFNIGAQNLEAESNTNVGGAAIKGAVAGAALGSVVPVIGTAIGGVLGGATGAITAGLNNKSIKEQEKKDFQIAAGQELLSPSGRKYGGYVEKLHNGGKLPYPHKEPHPPGKFEPIATAPNLNYNQIQDIVNNPDIGKIDYITKKFGLNQDILPQDIKESIIKRKKANSINNAVKNNFDPTINNESTTQNTGEDSGDLRPSQNIENSPFYGYNKQDFNYLDIEKDIDRKKRQDLFINRYTGNNTQYTGDNTQDDKTGEDEKGFPWLPVAAGAASLAPFIGNLIEGSNLDAPEANRYVRAGRTYLPNFADEKKMLNVVDQSFGGADQAIANASVGNIGAYRANLLGSNINKARARSSAFANINDINRQEISAKNADYANAIKEDTGLRNQEIVEDKQDRAAYDAAKNAYRTAAYEGLGNLGETIFKANQMSDLTTYDPITGKKKKQDGNS